MKIAELEKPLDPKHIVKPSGSFGPKGDYLEGWHVINEMNRIFGFGGWSYTINLSQDALTEGKNGKGDIQWQAAYTCVCTLTVQTLDGNVVRQDVGFGSGFAKQVGDAIEGATKEAVTDSLKRAARTFGNPFGLALYDKQRANVGVPVITDDQRIELVNLMESVGFAVSEFLTVSRIPDLRQLPADKFEGAKNWINQQTKKEAA